jgi:5'-nucleotidase
LIILVDQDGVLANFDKAHAEKCRAKGFPDHIALEMRDYWQMLDGLTAEEIRAVLDVWHEPGFFADMEPIQGARDALFQMRSLGHDVFICTTPLKGHATCAAEKEKWIRDHIGREFTDHIIMTRDKTVVHGDILIDDKPLIEGLRKPHWEHIVFDARYNRSVMGKRRLTWENWNEVI